MISIHNHKMLEKTIQEFVLIVEELWYKYSKISILLNALKHSGMRNITKTWLRIKYPGEEQTSSNTSSW